MKRTITKKRTVILLLAGFLAVGTAAAGRALPFADEVADKTELMQQQEQTRAEAAELEQAKKELQSSLDSLDLKLVDVSNEVDALAGEIEQVEASIAEAEDALAVTEAEAAAQYASMKLRIQYMYENGGTMSWTSIFSAKSFVDALNRVEYAMSLASADRRLFEEYKDTLAQLKSDRETLFDKREELLAANAQLDDKKSELLASIGTVQSDVEDTDAALAQKEADLAELADQLTAMEEYERKLEEQKAKEAAEEQARLKEEQQKAEEEAKKKAEEEAAAGTGDETAGQDGAADSPENGTGDGTEDGNAGQDSGDGAGSGDTGQDSGDGAGSGGTGQDSGTGTAAGTVDDALRYYVHTTTPVTVSAEEEELFAALVYCEAGGESYETQFAVASVVVNRINSSRYPNSLIDVIYQKNQFSPASSGRLAVVLEKGLATESCRKAAREALAGNICGDWLNFNYNFGTIDGLVIGTEVFYEV